MALDPGIPRPQAGRLGNGAIELPRRKTRDRHVYRRTSARNTPDGPTSQKPGPVAHRTASLPIVPPAVSSLSGVIAHPAPGVPAPLSDGPRLPGQLQRLFEPRQTLGGVALSQVRNCSSRVPSPGTGCRSGLTGVISIYCLHRPATSGFAPDVRYRPGPAPARRAF